MDSVIMSDYDRTSELKAFDDSKAGVKGLVDAGVTKVPRIFVHEQVKLGDEKSQSPGDPEYNIPVIDFRGIDDYARRRGEIIDEVKDACEKWGCFQAINHGVPVSVMNKMIDGVQKFHEQDTEVKKQFYSRDLSRRFRYNSNYDLYQSPVANWRDSIEWIMEPHLSEPEELPEVCRNIMIEYSEYVKRLGLTLFELISEALGLDLNHLTDMGFAERLFLFGHYYPECPEPELTFGTSNHTDGGFITVLLQDQIGGLQVLHNNQWVDVPSLPGALAVNVGDLVQLSTNDKLKSVNHRVLARNVGPRISIAGFFTEGNLSRLHKPIKELLSEVNQPVYREITAQEFFALRRKKALDGNSALSTLKLHNLTMEL